MCGAGVVDSAVQPIKRWRARLGSLATRRLLLAYALVAPVILLRLATSVYPFAATIYLSLFNDNPSTQTFSFVGLGNYVAMAGDASIRGALSFTLFFTVASVSIQLVCGLGIAELLNRPFPFQGIARAVTLLPWAMPLIVVGTAAVWIFNPSYGLIDDLIWRVSGARPLWLVDPTSARFAVTLTDVWKSTPFLAVIFIGGLQGIPHDLYEAARVDGADGLRSFWYVTLPLLKPLIITMVIFVAIYRILTFDIVYALTEGGPGTATSLMSYIVYVQAFQVLNFGYAAALAIGMFAIVLVVGLGGFWLLRRSWVNLG